MTTSNHGSIPIEVTREKFSVLFQELIDLIQLFIQDDYVDNAIVSGKQAYEDCMEMCDKSERDAIKMINQEIALDTDRHVCTTTYNTFHDIVTDITINDDDIKNINAMKALVINQFALDKKDEMLIPLIRTLVKLSKNYEVQEI